nr:hypothetical protein [uncultured Clostridium sp.]
MSEYSNNYKITATNYYNNFCYVEGIFDLSNFVNSTINLSVDSIIESSDNLSFTDQQINSSDLPKKNYYKKYFLLKSPVKANSKITMSNNITLKYNYLALLLGVKLSSDTTFTNPFDFIYRFNFKVNDTSFTPVYFGGSVDNIATITTLDSPVVDPPSDSTDYASKEYVDTEIKKISDSIPKIEVYTLSDLDKIGKKDNIIYFGY